MVIKFVNGFITALSFLVLCMSSADCVEYEPDEKTEEAHIELWKDWWTWRNMPWKWYC